ncbi:MAG: glycosyltransferase family 2 protein [Patescibacteria group bacterium]
MRTGSITAVVVNYKTRDLLAECLRSLYDEAHRLSVSFSVIVIENASHDGTVEMVRKDFPEATLIVNEENVGLAKANNQGISLAIDKSNTSSF